VAGVSGYPRIGIYRGEGSSHSWLWLVDLFERLGFWELEFPDDIAIRGGSLGSLDIFSVSGGDTFALAGALGEEGASAIRGFVEGGGLYLGSCAGAYLAMPSSRQPLSLFNFVQVKIANLASHLPHGLALREKAFTPYGCRYVFHPVRETVRLRMEGDTMPLLPRLFDAPLYGGPAMLPGEGCEVIARYAGFSKKTVFLADEKTSAMTLLDRAAIVRCQLGRGCFYLLGPHLEHPGYQDANRLLGRIIEKEKGAAPGSGLMVHEKTRGFRGIAAALRKELGNARIAASSLEFEPVKWRVGSKVYDPERIMVFIEAVWRRIPFLQEEGPDDGLLEGARRITTLMRTIRSAVVEKEEAGGLVEELLQVLRAFAASFFSIYFRSLRERTCLDCDCPDKFQRRCA
jgi:hypothetical protein